MLIAQVTDIHLGFQPDDPAELNRKRFDDVITTLLAMEPRPDLLLATGDLSDQGTIVSYRTMKALCDALPFPVLPALGNHDNREEMRAAFSDKTYIPQDGFIQYIIDDYPVRLIGLDTNVPKEAYGILCKQRLLWLEKNLKTNPSKPTLLFMHHFPMKVGQKCFDNMICRLEDDLEKLIQSFPNVMGIVAGHYHKMCASLFGGRICFVAPSTAPTHYFASDEDNYVTAIDLVHPSFTIHRWMGGFQMVSECIQAIEYNKRLPMARRESDNE